MIALGSFALLRPYWLLLLPALLALLLLTTRRDSALGDWRRAVDAPLLAALLRRQGGAGRASRDAALYWSVALLALALSGPAVKSSGATQFRNLDALLVLLDVSNGRNLPQAAGAAQLVLAGGGARQTGLVLYAGDAYLASPMTDDVAALEALLFAVDEKTVPDGGARPDRALAFARRLTRETGAFAADVILISGGDGAADARASREAAALAAEGHMLHTLFAAPASPAGAAGALSALAAAGRGVSGDAAHADDILAALSGRRVERVEQSARRALEWRDCGRWLLLLAAAPLLLYLRGGAS